MPSSTTSTMPLNELKPPGMRFFNRSWPLRMTSSMSGGRREPNGPPPPPRLPPPPPHGPPLLPPPPPPQGPPLLLFHAIVHLRAHWPASPRGALSALLSGRAAYM